MFTSSLDSSILVKFENVYKNFDKKLLLSNINFSIKKGDVVTLIGPNGAGKTTIARLILGLEKPSKGQVILKPNLKISYVPQKLEFASNFPITAKEFLNLLISNNSNYSENINWKQLSNFMGFDFYKNQDISVLSGGQLQKLLLSIALLNASDLIVLDEPTQSLDVVSQQEFYSLINQIKKQYNVTIFMISHDLFTVMKNSDQVICLNGHICCSGKPNDLKNNQEFLNTLSTIGVYIHNHDHKH